MENDLTCDKLEEVAAIGTSFSILCSTTETTGCAMNQETLTSSRDLNEKASHVVESADAMEILKPEQERNSLDDVSSELRGNASSTCGHEELNRLEEEYELLKEAVEMALNDERSVSFYIANLNEQIAENRSNLQELENRWDIVRKPLEDKRRNLLESFCGTSPESQLKLQKLKQTELDLHSILAEIRKRKEDCARLASDLENQPKAASRRSFIQRITEITKNSRKLDIDIERILKETRELKLESNSTEERLDRTYAVVDETVFREAKTDSVCRQAYRLLTGIHESFEEMRKQILAADKARREAAELEAKILLIASRSSVMDQLQADLDALRKENENLERNLQNH